MSRWGSGSLRTEGAAVNGKRRCSSSQEKKKKAVILHKKSAAATGALLSIKHCESFQPGNLLNFVTKPRAVRNYRGRQTSCTTPCPKGFSHGAESHCGSSKAKMKGKQDILKNQLQTSLLLHLQRCIAVIRNSDVLYILIGCLGHNHYHYTLHCIAIPTMTAVPAWIHHSVAQTGTRIQAIYCHC